jgi:hypothetical protein
MTLRHRVHRVLYVPLDDRPVNLTMPLLLAGIVDYEMVVPPRSLLGSYHTPGKPEALGHWLLSQTDQPDCLILSLDMLLYGGLIASRQPNLPLEVAQSRLRLVQKVRERFSQAALYASSVLCRLDMPMDPEDRLRYGDRFYPYTRLGDAPEAQEEVQTLLQSLPADLVERYQQVRRRNHEINRAAVAQVADGLLDFLVLAQDDADTQGFHRAEQKALRAQIEQARVGERVVICAGADETGATLFSHFVHEHMEDRPQVAVLYLDPEGAQRVAPFEDRPFGENLMAQARVAGVDLVQDPAEAGMVLAVSPPLAGPRETTVGCPEHTARRRRLAQFAREIVSLSEKRGVAICDAALPNGAEAALVEALREAGLSWPQLLSFSAWNTAGNSLGAALAHGTVRLISLRDKAAFDLAQLVTSISPMRYFELLNSLIGAERAHLTLLFTRLVDDWLYQTQVRAVVKERLADMVAEASFELTEAFPRAENLVREMLMEAASSLWVEEFMGQRAGEIGPPGRRSALALAELQDTRVRLPWRRLFEVELEFDLGLELTAAE